MLPIIRLSQSQTPLVRQRQTQPGQWVMYRDNCEFININRFKMLVLAHRQIMVHFDLFHNHYVVARQGELDQWQRLVAAKLAGKNVRDGVETFVWLPHYQELAIIQITASSGRRAIRNLTPAELYGMGSRIASSNGRNFYVPSPEKLNLPVVVEPQLTSATRILFQENFESGVPV